MSDSGRHFSGALTWVLELGSIWTFLSAQLLFCIQTINLSDDVKRIKHHVSGYLLAEGGRGTGASSKGEGGAGLLLVIRSNRVYVRVYVHWLTPAHSWVESWNIVGKISSPRSNLRRDGYFFPSHCESVTFWVIATGSCDCGFLCTFWTSRVPLQVTLSHFHRLRAEEAKKQRYSKKILVKEQQSLSSSEKSFTLWKNSSFIHATSSKNG